MFYISTFIVVKNVSSPANLDVAVYVAIVYDNYDVIDVYIYCMIYKDDDIKLSGLNGLVIRLL